MAKINEKVPEKKAGRKELPKEMRKVVRQVYMTPTQWSEIDEEIDAGRSLGEMFYQWFKEAKSLANQLEETIQNS